MPESPPNEPWVTTDHLGITFRDDEGELTHGSCPAPHCVDMVEIKGNRFVTHWVDGRVCAWSGMCVVVARPRKGRNSYVVG